MRNLKLREKVGRKKNKNKKHDCISSRKFFPTLEISDRFTYVPSFMRPNSIQKSNGEKEKESKREEMPDLPDAGPLESDPGHVVVGDLDQLGQGEHARTLGLLQLLHRHVTQPRHKVHDRIPVQPNGPCHQCTPTTAVLDQARLHHAIGQLFGNRS